MDYAADRIPRNTVSQFVAADFDTIAICAKLKFSLALAAQRGNERSTTIAD
jgi:hypothetical protein